jgi:hypothetical protein
LASDFTLSCGSVSGPDSVFRFTLAEMQDVRVTVTGGGSGATVALRPFASCAAGPDDKCSGANPPRILRRSLPAGEYAIIVKTGFGAAFDLTLSIMPPTPIPPVDVCNAGTQDVSAGGTFSGMFVEVEDVYTLSCHTPGTREYRDAAYRLRLTEPKDVTITGSTTGPFGTTTGYVSLVTNCADSGSTIQCVSGFGTTTLRRRGLAAGTYYILLESSDTEAIDWTLTVDVTDPVPRIAADACSTAVDITSMSGSIPLAMAEHDGSNSCRVGTFYRDAFFYFDLPSTRDVRVTTTVTGTASTFHGTSLSTTCGAVGTELRCTTGSSPLVQNWRSLAAGRYYVTPAANATTGTLGASVETFAPTPIPPNDRCGGAIRLTNGAVRNDTLIGFEDDASGCSSTVSRPDAFYEVRVTARSMVTVVVTPSAGWMGSAYLTLRNSCTSTTNIECHTGSPGVISRVLEPGTYILIVESSSASTAGDFTISSLITPT